MTSGHVIPKLALKEGGVLMAGFLSAGSHINIEAASLIEKLNFDFVSCFQRNNVAEFPRKSIVRFPRRRIEARECSYLF
jgi:hypothetical protein